MANVFISYSKRDYIGDDGKVIRDNVIDIISRTFEENGISYWIDREGLDPGVTFADTIARSIKECDTFLFLSSKNSNTSFWTLNEISTAIEFGKKVLPVKLDHSSYADSVALYLASVQYVDWQELGSEESLKRIVARIKSGDEKTSLRYFDRKKLPKITSAALYAGLVFLTAVYAVLTYQFLWAKSLRSTEIMGGLVGYICEFGVLLSIYYLIRIIRLRKCVFVLPALAVGITFLSGMLIRDSEVMFCAILLFVGWLCILFTCLIGNSKDRSFFKLMSKDQMMLKISDQENLILVYLVIKAVIIVVAHYFGLSMVHTLMLTYL